MNNKEKLLDAVIDIVVECCDIRHNGKSILTKQDVLGKCKRENVVYTRSLLALQLKHEGYTIDTIACILDRSSDSVRDMIASAYESISTNRVFRKSAAEVALRCCDIEDDIEKAV